MGVRIVYENPAAVREELTCGGRLNARLGRIGHRLTGERAIGTLAQQFDLLFRSAKHAAAMLDEEIAAFVFRQALFETNLSGFNFRENLLELLERLFEVFRRCLCFLGHWDQIITERGW